MGKDKIDFSGVEVDPWSDPSERGNYMCQRRLAADLEHTSITFRRALDPIIGKGANAMQQVYSQIGDGIARHILGVMAEGLRGPTNFTPQKSDGTEKVGLISSDSLAMLLYSREIPSNLGRASICASWNSRKGDQRLDLTKAIPWMRDVVDYMRNKADSGGMVVQNFERSSSPCDVLVGAMDQTYLNVGREGTPDCGKFRTQLKAKKLPRSLRTGDNHERDFYLQAQVNYADGMATAVKQALGIHITQKSLATEDEARAKLPASR